MNYANVLPEPLRDAEQLMKRRDAAAGRKEMWRSTYRECYEYTMPQRETFTWYSPGQKKNTELYDSTGQECVYAASNNMQALLCPSWKIWAQLTAGADVDREEAESTEVVDQLQEVTETVFDFLNHSNFSTVIPEVLLDLQVGTGAMCLDEGEDDQPLVFDAIPLSSLELEEGPNGTVETVFMKRCPLARNLPRMYRGLQMEKLPSQIKSKITKDPNTTIEIIQAVIYHPKDKHYYGVVFTCDGKHILWAADYETSSPYIVGRMSVTAGEIYGRGPVMWALPDIKSLNEMMFDQLTNAKLKMFPPLTAVTDGVMNPYTAVIAPNTILPVGSNDNGNPSIRALDVGGDMAYAVNLMEQLRQRVRRIMLGEMEQSGPVKSATEWMIHDRNRLWNMGAVYGRIQSELLSKIIDRVVYILAKRGKIPGIRVDGKLVTLKYVSPLARAQDDEDLMALQKTMEITAPLGPEALAASLKVERIGSWVGKKSGLDADLIRSEDETDKLVQAATQGAALQAAQANGAIPPGAGGNVVPMRGAA